MSVVMGAQSCRRESAAGNREPSGPPAALATANLTDQDGRALRFSDFQGKSVVLSFFFTSCPSVCPRQAKALAEVQQRLAPETKDRVRFVSLTVDPDNDAPEQLRAFARNNGVDLSTWSLVRTSEPTTTALAKELAVFDASPQAEPAPASHTTSVYLFDRGGRLMQRYMGSPLDTSRLAREIEQLDGMVRDGELEVRKLRL